MSVAPTVVLFSSESDFHTDAVIGHRGVSRALLAKLKLPVPASFIITSTGFYRFLHHDNGLNHWRSLIENAEAFSNEDMVTCARSLQNLVLHHSFDPDLATEISSAYHQTLKKSWAHLTISPTSTTPAPVHFPLPVIKGETSLLDFLRQLWASQLSPHALSLHLTQNKNQLFTPAPVLVSQFEKALISGTIYSIDPQTGDKNLLRLETIWGTNPQNDPQPIHPDIFILAKSSGEIISRVYGKQTTQLAIDRFGHFKNTPLTSTQIASPKLSPLQVQTLVQAALKIQNNLLKSQALNWLVVDKQIIFTRFAEITETHPSYQPPLHHTEKTAPTIIATGLPAAPGITTAPLIHPHLNSNISGRIAVFKEANPLLIKRASQAAGIIIESGGLTSELAMTAREIGIPTIVGTGPLSLPDGQVVTIDASNGKIYKPNTQPTPLVQASPTKRPRQLDKDKSRLTATKIYLSLHNYKPDELNNYTSASGVGQYRSSQLIIENGIHPKHLKKDLLKQIICPSLEAVCDGFGDRPVWYHPYDLDTGTAANLTHGSIYEPTIEPNPLMGFRGTYRLIHDDSIFSIELECIKQLRHKKNLKNLHLTLPLIRSIDEFKVAKRIITSHGLYQAPSFMLYAEIGTPAAVELIPQLSAEGVNGLHLNLDLLATLIQGYDSNCAEVDQCLDYAHPAVTSALTSIVTAAGKNQLPLIVSSFMFDQSSKIVEMVIQAGVGAIVISPHRYQNVSDWVAASEAAVLQPKS